MFSPPYPAWVLLWFQKCYAHMPGGIGAVGGFIVSVFPFLARWLKQGCVRSTPEVLIKNCLYKFYLFIRQAVSAPSEYMLHKEGPASFLRTTFPRLHVLDEPVIIPSKPSSAGNPTDAQRFRALAAPVGIARSSTVRNAPGSREGLPRVADRLRACS